MKKNILIAIGLSVITFIVYLLTAPASIWTGDSGEIVTAVATWGVAHPTGFPVYLILGKLFTIIFSFLEPAFALNIFSAISSALGVAILFLILREIKFNYWISIASALSLGFAYTFWSHANVARVYSLSALFFAAAILVYLHWAASGRRWKLYLLAVICGLGIGTHLTFLLIFPFILVYSFVKNTRPHLKDIIIFVLVFLCSSAFVYAYIPWRASMSPELNWGNPSTVENFLSYITQADYSQKVGARDISSIKLMLKETGKLFNKEFTPIGLIFVLLGAWIVRKKQKELFWAGISVIIANILLMANYGNDSDIMILYRYFLPTYIIMAIFLSFGLGRIFSSSVIPAKAGILSLILPIIIFALHFNDLNRHNNNLLKNTTNYILSSVPQNSILITGGDTLTGAMLYEQKILKGRNDLLIVDDKLYTHDWYLENKKKEIENKNLKFQDTLGLLVSDNLDKGIYSVSNSISFLKINFDFVPHSLVYKLEKKNGSGFNIKEVNKNFWDNSDLNFLQDKRLDKEYFNKELVLLYTTSLNNFAAYMANKINIEDGINYFKKSLEIRENENALYNLAGIYNALGNSSEAIKYKDRFDNFEN